MKASKYSNGGASSKYSAVFSEDVCEEHDGMPFTNFCSSISCVRPLCPQCVENHSSVHRSMRTQPEMTSLKTLKNQCVNKIMGILNRVQMSENEGAMNEINVIFEGTLSRIRELKDLSRKIIDTYFSSLQDTVRRKMSSLMSEQSDLFQELQRANNIINELKLLVHRMDNSRQFLNSAQTIIRLDGDKIQDKVRNSFATVSSLKENYKGYFHVEKGYEQRFVNFLSKSAFYGSHENQILAPKVIEQVMAAQNMKNFSRKSSDNNFDSDKVSRYDREEEKHRSKQKSMKYGMNQRDDDKRSEVSKRSSKSKGGRVKKNLLGINTFKESSPHKYLHFFMKDQNILQYLDLEQGQAVFSSIQLDITFKIPEFHKSISVPNGDLYLIGGSLAVNGLKSQKIYKYDFAKNTLICTSTMKFGRSSHSVCFNNKYIYILGGFLNNQITTNRCERYDIINNRVEEIKPMNYEACSFACCSFNGRFIYKFGGVMSDNTITNVIEVYDENEGQWEFVNPMMQGGGFIVPVSFTAAIQITQNEIMVMGGYDENNDGQKQTYIFRVDSTGSYIREINAFQLTFAEGFWNNTPILHKKHVFALQNISGGQDECLDDERRILVFDGRGWKCLN